MHLNAQIFAEFGEKMSDSTLHAKSGGCVLNAQIFADFGEKSSVVKLACHGVVDMS